MAARVTRRPSISCAPLHRPLTGPAHNGAPPQPVRLTSLPPPWILAPNAHLPCGKSVAVFGPHPDDFDAISITLRRAQAGHATIHLAVMTSGANGVAAEDYPGLDRQERARLREAEQLESCRHFGLAPDEVEFLRLDESPGELVENSESIGRVRKLLERWKPDLVFLPHPNDPNPAHQGTFGIVRRSLFKLEPDAVLLLNRDPKTIAMRTDLYVRFDAGEAEWKRRLLCYHESQQRRNLRTRGKGLDDRILDLNAALAAEIDQIGYAEGFELRRSSNA